MYCKKLLSVCALFVIFSLFVLPSVVTAVTVDDLRQRVQEAQIEDTNQNSQTDGEISPTNTDQQEMDKLGENPLTGVRALLDEGKFKAAIAQLNDLLTQPKFEKEHPFFQYLLGQIAAYHLKDKALAEGYYAACAKQYEGSRYGNLAAEQQLLLKENTLTEVAMKERMTETRSEIASLMKELDETSFFRLMKKAELKKKIEELQQRYLSQRQLLADYQESPESLIDRDMGNSSEVENTGKITEKPTVAKKKMGVCLSDGYRVRTEPWGDIIGKLNKGDKVEIIGKTESKGEVWYKIRMGDLEGYTFNKGIGIVANDEETDGPRRVSKTKTGRCIKEDYNVRAEPWGDKLGTLRMGEKVTILGETKRDGKIWYKIRYKQQTAYVFNEGIAIDGAIGEPEPQDEFQSGIVANLAELLYGNGNNLTKLGDNELFMFFLENPVLSEGFAEIVDKRDVSELKKVIIGLERMLHNTPLRKCLNDPLASKDYRKAYDLYKEKYLKNYDDPSIYSFKEDAVPVTIINVPAKRLRVYRDGLKIFDVPMVPGMKTKGDEGNTNTRVGKFKITSWHTDYTTSAYPYKWSENKLKGAFGKYAAKIGPNGAGQHIHGTTGPEWFGNIPINYAPGSHGCIRLANKNIDRYKEMAPIGTKVIKTYCIHERSSRSVLGFESVKDNIFDNLYNYDVDGSGQGCFYPDAGVLLNHSEPKDAIR